VPAKVLFFQKFTVSGFEPFIKALFRNPVDGADPDPTEFIPLQECINGFAADAYGGLRGTMGMTRCVPPACRIRSCSSEQGFFCCTFAMGDISS